MIVITVGVLPHDVGGGQGRLINTLQSSGQASTVKDYPAHMSQVPRRRNPALSKGKKSLIPGQRSLAFTGSYTSSQRAYNFLQISSAAEYIPIIRHLFFNIYLEEALPTPGKKKKKILDFATSADSCFTFYLNLKELKNMYSDQPKKELGFHQ